METFGLSRKVYGEDTDLLYKAFSQNDLRGASRAGRRIMQRYVASDGTTFEGESV